MGKVIDMKNLLVTLSIYVLICFLLILFSFTKLVVNFSDSEWSTIFVSMILAIFIFRYINKIKLLSVYSLFFFTTLIFIGGRFIAAFLGYTEEHIFTLDFFVYRELIDIYKTRLMLFVLNIFIMLEAGMYASKLFTLNKQNLPNITRTSTIPRFNIYTLYIMIFIIIIFLVASLPELINNVLSNGYLALYEGQSKNYEVGLLSKAITLLYATLGIFLTQTNKKLKKIDISILIIFSVIYMILGSRGTFVCNILFLLWVYYELGDRKLNILKLLSLFVIISLFLSFGFSLLTLREMDSENQSGYSSVLNLIFDQGITLMVFNESINIENYPILPMIQNFIPGTIFIASNFVQVAPQNVSYANYLAYNLNPALFSQGYGLGWSVFSDFYVLAGQSLVGFSIIVFLWSYYINKVDKWAKSNLFWRIINISTLPALLFLPRAGLYIYYPLYLYVLILIIFMKIKFKK